MRQALFVGSFDPLTFGHVDITLRVAQIFDRVIFAVAKNASKQPMFSASERVALAEQVFAEYKNIEVVELPGLVADYAAQRQVKAIVKGLRNGADFDGELPMALMNRALGQVETLFIPGSAQYAHIASSFVKDIARHGGDVRDFVPEVVVHALKQKGVDQ